MQMVLPRSILDLVGIAGSKADLVGIVDLLNADVRIQIEKKISDLSIVSSLKTYRCVEKWTYSAPIGGFLVVSFISFGVGSGEKTWKKTISEELDSFCSHQMELKADKVFIYGSGQCVVIVGVCMCEAGGKTCAKQIVK